MKVHTLSLVIATALFSTHLAAAHYPSHGFRYHNVELSECKAYAMEAAAKHGFPSVTATDQTTNNNSASFLTGLNGEGYNFQAACEAYKGFFYVVINGPKQDKLDGIRNAILEDFDAALNRKK